MKLHIAHFLTLLMYIVDAPNPVGLNPNNEVPDTFRPPPRSTLHIGTNIWPTIRDPLGRIDRFTFPWVTGGGRPSML